jgi:hypothetical protein
MFPLIYGWKDRLMEIEKELCLEDDDEEEAPQSVEEQIGHPVVEFGCGCYIAKAKRYD